MPWRMILAEAAHRAYLRRYASRVNWIFVLHHGQEWLTREKFDAGWLKTAIGGTTPPYGACRNVDELLLALRDAGLVLLHGDVLHREVCTRWRSPAERERTHTSELALATFCPTACAQQRSRRL